MNFNRKFQNELCIEFAISYIKVVQDTPPVLSVSGVFFTCPLVGSEVLPKAEIEAKIREYLYLQLTEEPGLAAPWIIQTCNRDKEKVHKCSISLALFKSVVH